MIESAAAVRWRMETTWPSTCCVLLFPSLFSADILLNRSQQLFVSCTAKFADGQQCSIPVFDITHQTPLCEEHAKKMVSAPSPVLRSDRGLLRFSRPDQLCFTQDNFLRGDGNRRVQHQQPHQRKPRKKTKPPALTKKHKKKRRRGPRRPQKPIPPALPQGNLGMPSSSLALSSQASIRSAVLHHSHPVKDLARGDQVSRSEQLLSHATSER